MYSELVYTGQVRPSDRIKPILGALGILQKPCVGGSSVDTMATKCKIAQTQQNKSTQVCYTVVVMQLGK